MIPGEEHREEEAAKEDVDVSVSPTLASFDAPIGLATFAEYPVQGKL